MTTPTPSTNPRPCIEDYAVIGNCRTLALVSRFGSIDWLCVPRFSGPSYFAALLDQDRGGCFDIAPREVHETEQRYIEGTNVLETVFQCAHGVLKVTDFMAMPRDCDPSLQNEEADAHTIVRMLACTSGHVALEANYRPRPAYACAQASITRQDTPDRTERWACSWRDGVAYLDTNLSFHERDNDLVTSLSMEAGEARHALLSFGRPRALPRSEDQLDATVKWWRTWSGQCRYEGAYREAVVRSSLALKLLTYAPSGAVVAAGTTSLPEDKTGDRNWDYRYCWLRDTSLVLQAFMDLGYLSESDAFLGWLLHATKRDAPDLKVMYDVQGEAVISEKELTHLRGYHGLGPVRIGNDARQQLQLDIYGEVILTACAFVHRGGQLSHQEQTLLAGLAEQVCQQWRRPDAGLWEIRLPPRHNTHSKLMCWAALDRILQLNEAVALQIDAERVRIERDAIRADIDAQGFHSDLGSYVGYYGGPYADASLLLMPRFDFLRADDPKMTGTVRHIQAKLSRQGLLYRYPPDVGYDGVPGTENLFGICSFWLVDCLARQGRIEEGHALFTHLLSLRNHAGLYAEEFDATTLQPLGNFPQAFSHVGMITAALALEKYGQPSQ